MNELVLYNKIETRLKQKREPTIFPLMPMHRRELRDLKLKNIGNLKERVATIQALKKEEFVKNNIKQIKQQVEKYVDWVEALNSDWQNRLKKINKILSERKDIESRLDMKFFEVDYGYEAIAKLEKLESKRKFSCDVEKISRKISEKQFNDKYEKAFDDVLTLIADISTKYEEAINFGDLEIVKELYYIMKNSETLFEKISNLKV